MPTTLVQDGDRWPITASGNVTAGNIVVIFSGIKGLAGVAMDTVTTGTVVPVATKGVFTVTKKAGATLDFAVGEPAYTTATGAATPTATGNTPLGRAFAAAVTGATTVQVQLISAGAFF